MFEARLNSALVLKRIVEAVKDMLKEGVLNCSNTGIKMRAMDNCHVSLLYLDLDADGFDHYRCDRDFVMGINFKTLAMVLKCADPDDSVSIEHNPDFDVVTFIFESKNNKKEKYDIKLMNLDNEQLEAVDPPIECVVKMPSQQLAHIFRNMSTFGENVVISYENGAIDFKSSGDYGSVTSIIGGAGGDQSISIKATTPISKIFSLQFLNLFTKATPLSQRVCMRLSSEFPMSLEYEIPNIGYIRYYLMSKIDEFND